MFKKGFPIIGIAFAVIVIIGGVLVWQLWPENETAGWQTYKNESIGYQLDYPTNWIIAKREFSGCGTNCKYLEDLLIQNLPNVSFPGNGPEDGSQFGITILEFSSPSPLTLKNLIMSFDIPEVDKQKRLNSIKTMKIAGIEREVWNASVDWQGGVWFVDANKLYKLDYLSGSAEQFNKDLNTFNQILSTFRFLK